MKNPDQAWKEAGRKPRQPKDQTPKRRAKLVAGIENAMRQAGSGEGNPKRGWFTTKGNVARVTIKAGNKIIPINGREYNVVPAERVSDFYKGALVAAKGGELDAEMNATYEAGGKRKAGGSGGGWSPARRAAFEAAKKK